VAAVSLIEDTVAKVVGLDVESMGSRKDIHVDPVVVHYSDAAMPTRKDRLHLCSNPIKHGPHKNRIQHAVLSAST
jgi:hypothetical protein